MLRAYAFPCILRRLRNRAPACISRLAVPGECCGLTLFLAFSDRCGNCELASSATDSASPQFPRQRQGLCHPEARGDEESRGDDVGAAISRPPPVQTVGAGASTACSSVILSEAGGRVEGSSHVRRKRFFDCAADGGSAQNDRIRGFFVPSRSWESSRGQSAS